MEIPFPEPKNTGLIPKPDTDNRLMAIKMNGTTYRNLTQAEIDTLELNGCSAAGWSSVEVAEAFIPDSIRHCRFSGRVRIGKNVQIDGIHESIENYEIGDNVVIKNTESLICNPGSTFGNGTRVSVLIESGGREVTIYNGLSAPVAYLTAMYRHRPETVRQIEELIAWEIQNNNPELGQIGQGTYIAHCGALTDICTGENAVLKGAAELTNGTIKSTADAPTTIGRGVIARDFIVSDSTEITDFAQLEKCYFGQGCRIDKGFTAENSLFFANCECFQGEACSVFAGPYTVTHHKSTLLIGGMFSFYNAGSNSNQSNHMYRLGPIHQGILERGCKTGSGSYILFPAHIGAFSIVKGRHYHHPDTSLLPFSYLVEDNGRTVLLPGANLRSIGLARDEKKWPDRDKRKADKHDPIAFDVLTPYTIEKIVAGFELLNEWSAPGDIPYHGTFIPARQVERGKAYYRKAVDFYLARTIAKRIQADQPIDTVSAISHHWVDLCGMTAPQDEIEGILKLLPNMRSIHELGTALVGIHHHFSEYEWQYAAHLLEKFYHKPVTELTNLEWSEILENGKSAARTFLDWRREDTAKESDRIMQAGYGLSGTESESETEFTAIHRTGTDRIHESLLSEYDNYVEKMEATLRTLP